MSDNVLLIVVLIWIGLVIYFLISRHLFKPKLEQEYLESLDIGKWKESNAIREEVERKIKKTISPGYHIIVLDELYDRGLVEFKVNPVSGGPRRIPSRDYRLMHKGKVARDNLTEVHQNKAVAI